VLLLQTFEISQTHQGSEGFPRRSIMTAAEGHLRHLQRTRHASRNRCTVTAGRADKGVADHGAELGIALEGFHWGGNVRGLASELM
jgi:hypothetical protein